MMNRSSTVVVFLALAVAAFVLLSAPDAAAQCAMCRAAVEAGGERSARTMNTAMLVLLIPPVTMFCSAFALVYKYRQPRDGEGE